ncbi:MAG: hypothetical protein A2487_07300 [Candidatus Raymondbacteria bacterium RifOxyC12_full_50_8]|uniref:Antitoxin n=1 Tax=Candidatus Raymondbacteria bacterium RIFOXYD12_FULL_49_13 TaxID=1817890 RepID=A0A1F7F384_UNCRA|nr:MAG: hypothetical protein A2248_08870 [Candidatus Raymondbacteria bacterium RIFOXYA2_FULL_49_16]OGJ96785.1 MAG: hypothetical protein A2487_07300 [Candidatus Raymondbacteria bacterium RifOxyC12_full_50_8]OGK01125.1 MAG: hypothetical protein A2519_20400 [Candidatus Raymondbacteria bacterium RIFOXYD12_FULL_49_13]OGP39346.1 MAG: hypothetical protein A2324_16910 [Candidatus Raymondbacteria bacterium RIFOXYB2_FULL_49_35]
MRENEIVLDVLQSIRTAAVRILKKMEAIHSPADFDATEENKDSLDVICMQLTGIGEGLKQIDKLTDGRLLDGYPEVDWKGLKGVRDVIAHQYFSISTEAVYDACRKDIPALMAAVEKIIRDKC